MARRAFVIGGRVAVAAGVLAAIAAVSVIVIGVLALSGRVTYPVTVGLGPISLSHQVSLPVSFGAAVCQSASVSDPSPPSECQRFFVHDSDSPRESQSRDVRVQDADVRPTTASLTGEVALATTGGWSRLVALSVARTAILLTAAGAALVLVGRLLGGLAADEVSLAGAVRLVRNLGWVFVIGGVVDATFGLFSSASALGYSVEMFGPGPHLSPEAPVGVDLLPIVVGGMFHLVAEVFRRGVNDRVQGVATV